MGNYGNRTRDLSHPKRESYHQTKFPLAAKGNQLTVVQLLHISKSHKLHFRKKARKLHIPANQQVMLQAKTTCTMAKLLPYNINDKICSNCTTVIFVSHILQCFPDCQYVTQHVDGTNLSIACNTHSNLHWKSYRYCVQSLPNMDYATVYIPCTCANQ